MKKTGRIISIFILILIVIFIVIFLVYNKKIEKLETESSTKIENEIEKCQYKSFKPSFKLSEDSIGDDYDFSQDMEYNDSIYYRKINNYEEYSEVKTRWNEILDMSKEDFNNSFMVITAIENTSMLGLNADKIQTYNDTLYITLKLEGDVIGENTSNPEYEKTCISYIIPRSMERNNIKCVRDLRDDEKDFDENMKIAETSTYAGAYSFQYRDEEYRKTEEMSNSNDSQLKLKEQYWKDSISTNFMVDKNMPDIDFNNWENIGSDFYCLKITNYSDYIKLMDTYNIKKLTWRDFKYVYPVVIIRTNKDYSITAESLKKDEKGNLYLPVSTGGLLDVSEDFKYLGIVTILPNYTSLEENNFDIKVE